MSEPQQIIVVEPAWQDPKTRTGIGKIDWARINRLVARGFTRLYPINGAWVIAAKHWVTQKRAMQLWRANGHRGPHR
jgi:hypothetical protein